MRLLSQWWQFAQIQIQKVETKTGKDQSPCLDIPAFFLFFLVISWHFVTYSLRMTQSQYTSATHFWYNDRLWPISLTLVHCGVKHSQHYGGGTLLACEDFGRMFDHSFPACTFFFFNVEITSCKLIPFFMPGSVHSGSENWDDFGWMFPDKLHVSSFQDRFPHYAWTVA